MDETTLEGRKRMRKSRVLLAKKGNYGETVHNNIQCANVCLIKSLGRFALIPQGVRGQRELGAVQLEKSCAKQI